MMLVDGGAIVDISAEPGMFKVDNSSAPSVFNGELGESVKDIQSLSVWRRHAFASRRSMLIC